MCVKCQRCKKTTKLVKFEMILRIRSEDYYFLCVYCDDCFKSLQKDMIKDVKVKFFAPITKEDIEFYSKIEKRINVSKKILIIDKFDEKEQLFKIGGVGGEMEIGDK